MWYPQKVVEMDCIIIFLVLFPCYILAQIHVTVFVCERNSHVLDCNDGIINIVTAVYGRTQSTVCGTSGTTDCKRDVINNYNILDCNGQMQCTVEALNSIYGDPCRGFRKYLDITYTCEEGTDHTAEITSPNFNSEYPNNVDILWRMEAPMGSGIRLQFTHFQTQSCCDFVTIYHGPTPLFNEATERVRFSGDTVPLNVIPMNSFMWIRFTSNMYYRYQGFRAVAVIVTIPDWACDFYADDCTLMVTQGGWRNLKTDNYYYFRAQGNSGDTSSFSIPYNYTSNEGALSFTYHQWNPGNLVVTVCGNQTIISEETHPYIFYKYISYSCGVNRDVEIIFTATKNAEDTWIVLYNIQLFEMSIPSEGPTQTQSATTTQTAPSTRFVTSSHSQSATTAHSATYSQSATSSISISTLDEHTSVSSTSTTAAMSTGASNLQQPSKAVIPAVSSAIILLVIGLMIVAVFVYLRRRSREPKPVGPVDQDDDDPSLYNNPVYVSKEDDFTTPDLLVGINLRNGSSVSPALDLSPDVDNQYEDFDEDQKNTVKGGPLPTNNSSSRAGRLHSSPEAPDVDLVNTNMYHILERPESEVIYEEGDHTYEQAQGPAQSSRNPNERANGHNGTDDVYENSTFARPVGGLPLGKVQDGDKNGSSDGIAVLDDDEEYNALTFNQSSDITRVLKKPKIVGDHANNGYGALDLPQDKAASLSMNSAELHNDDVYNSLDEPTVGQQNGKPSTTGEQPNSKGDTVLEQGKESDYHNYQDPDQMDKERSGPRSPDLDVFSNDQYNILDSGKQAGDYHVYQSTDDKDGDYTELDTSKMNGEDEYSTIDLDHGNQPQASGVDSFEPIYSEEVYSEFN